MIVENAVLCNKCEDHIFSKTRHDFVECSCGNIAVDGGQEYLRRVGAGIREGYTDLSWSLEDSIYRECVDAAELAVNTGRTAHGIANAVMRALRRRDRIIADGEYRVMADYKDELMVVEPDGTVNRYKKVL